MIVISFQDHSGASACADVEPDPFQWAGSFLDCHIDYLIASLFLTNVYSTYQMLYSKTSIRRLAFLRFLDSLMGDGILDRDKVDLDTCLALSPHSES